MKLDFLMCHGACRYNEKADVFSFGVALYEVLSRTMLNMTKRGARPGEMVAVVTPAQCPPHSCSH